MKKGLIKSYNWDDYHTNSEVSLYAHEYLSFETVIGHMKYAFRRAILNNPFFIYRRVKRGILTGEFFWDIYYFLRFVFTPTTGNVKQKYYAKNRWPNLDFAKNLPAPSLYQKVRKQKIQVATPQLDEIPYTSLKQ